MATIHKLTKDGATIFPATITDAVVHPQTGKTLTSMMKDYNVSELFPSEGVDGGNKYNLALAIQVLGTHLTSAQKTGGIKLTFISSLSPYPTEEYYLGKSSWSTTASDWKQRFEVGDVVADPSGSWTPSTAEAYIDQQIVTEATIRLDQDVYTRSLIPLADEEDLTKNGSYLKFKDRPATNGMGRVILRNNIVNGVNTLTQSIMQATNTIYVIRYDFTLGEDITVPANCVLEFDGGSISGNGTNKNTITGNNTQIIAPKISIFTGIVIAGTWNVPKITSTWFSDAQNENVLKQLFNLCTNNIQNYVFIESGTYNVSVSTDKESVFLPSNNTYINIIGTIQMMTNGFPRYYIFDLSGKNNITIEGNGNLVGDALTHDYTTTESTHEWGMGIRAYSGCSDIVIRGLHIRLFTGDGMSIGPSNCIVENITIEKCRRQGITVGGAASNLTIKNFNIHDIGNFEEGGISITGTNPMAAIDIEPNSGDVLALNVDIANGIIANCKKGIENIKNNCNVRIRNIKASNIGELFKIYSLEQVVIENVYAENITTYAIRINNVKNAVLKNVICNYCSIFLQLMGTVEDVNNIDIDNISCVSDPLGSDYAHFIVIERNNVHINMRNVNYQKHNSDDHSPLFIKCTDEMYDNVQITASNMYVEGDVYNLSPIKCIVSNSSIVSAVSTIAGEFTISDCDITGHNSNNFITLRGNGKFTLNKVKATITAKRFILVSVGYDDTEIHINDCVIDFQPLDTDRILYTRGKNLTVRDTTIKVTETFNGIFSTSAVRLYNCIFIKGGVDSPIPGGTVYYDVKQGATDNRPTYLMGNYTIGQPYFDTTLGKPVYWNGTAWVDATGTAV